MRFRSTLILLLLLVGLGAYLYLVELPKAAEKDKKSILFDVEHEDVTSIDLIFADREIALTKEGDTWRMTKPVEAIGDEGSIKNLVNTVVTAEVKKELEDTPDLSQFDLEPAFATITFKVGDKTLPTLRVGKTTPVGGSAYAKREGEDAVLLTTSSVHYAVDKQPKDLRDKKILDFIEAEVRSFEVQRPASTFKVERKDDGWKVTPGGFPADENAVTTYLSSLRSIRAAEFPDDNPTDLTEYELDQPRLEIPIRFDDDRKITVRFGKQLPSKNLYVQTTELPGVYEVGEYAYRNLDKSARDLRDKTILTLDADDLQVVEVTRSDASSYTLSRKDGGWSVEGVDGTPKADAIDEWLGDLAELKGFEIMADAVEDPSLYALDNPMLRIALTGKDGTPIGTVLFGQLPNEQATDFTAMLEGGSTVYKVRSYVFTRLNRDPSALVEAPAADIPAAQPPSS